MKYKEIVSQLEILNNKIEKEIERISKDKTAFGKVSNLLIKLAKQALALEIAKFPLKKEASQQNQDGKGS